MPSLPDLNELHPHRPFVVSAYRTEQAGDRKDDHEDDYKNRTTDDLQPTLSFLKLKGVQTSLFWTPENPRRVKRLSYRHIRSTP